MLRVLLAAAALTTMAACATTPKPCTAEWIDYKLDRTLGRFAMENRSLVSDLRDLTTKDGEIDRVRVILLAAKADEIRAFARSFETIIVPELTSAFEQCSRQEDFVPAFTEFLRREGVAESTLQWVGPILATLQVIESEGRLQP